MPARLRRMAVGTLAKGGFELRRHSATRRQSLLSAAQVDLVLDVGAAGGAYGHQLRSFGYPGRILSFEPLSDAFQRLQASVADDSCWRGVHCALGEEEGEAVINVASNSDSSSLLPMREEHSRAAPQVVYVGRETVRVARLDDVSDSWLPEAVAPFLKIDTQGFERAVLEGATLTLERCVGLQLELSLVDLYQGGMLVDESISWAYQRGFELVGIEQGFSAPDGRLLQVDGVFFRKGLIAE